MRDRTSDAIDAFSTGADHAMIALGYLLGLAFVVIMFIAIPVGFWLAIQPWANRTAWRITAWRHRGR